jgi:hypothetical protein
LARGGRWECPPGKGGRDLASLFLYISSPAKAGSDLGGLGGIKIKFIVFFLTINII